MGTLKKYYSPLKNFCAEGITFTTLGMPETGSYLITSSREVQERLEKSKLFRRLFKVVPMAQAEESVAATEVQTEEESKTRYNASTLQEARDIIMRLRAERGMEAKTFPNTKSVLNAANELGIEFPNLKK